MPFTVTRVFLNDAIGISSVAALQPENESIRILFFLLNTLFSFILALSRAAAGSIFSLYCQRRQWFI